MEEGDGGWRKEIGGRWRKEMEEGGITFCISDSIIHFGEPLIPSELQRANQIGIYSFYSIYLFT